MKTPRSPYTAQAAFDSPLGRITLARTAAGLAGLWFDGQAHHPGPLAAPVDPDQRWLRATERALAAAVMSPIGVARRAWA